MPIVGMRRAAVISCARFAGTHSNTIAKAPSSLESGCLTGDILGGVVASTLDSKASVGVDRLRLEAEMTHHGNPALDHPLNHILMPVYTLEFDGMGAGRHQDDAESSAAASPFRKDRNGMSATTNLPAAPRATASV